MDLRHLRYFVTIADERHFGRASARLHVAQPALSRQMKDLEDELEVVLLDRNPRGVDLTPAGAALLAAARGLLAETGSALDRVRRAAAGLEGRLVVGASRSAMWRDFLPRAAAAVRSELPHVELDVREVEAGPAQWEAVRLGSYDLGIGTQPPRLKGLRSEPLFDTSFQCALLPGSHPLAQRRTLQPSALSALPVLWTRPAIHPPLLAAILDELDRLGIGSAHEFEYSGPHAVWIAVASGRGWCPASSGMMEWAPDGTVAVPVEDLHVPLANAAIWREDDRRSLLHLVLDALKRYRDALRGRSRARAATRAAAAAAPPTVPVAVTLRHLKACAALHGGESFGQAAARLGITQPALSRQIKDLEREVGVTLVDRSAQGIRITPGGEALAADAARILGIVDDLRAAMVRARRLQAQHVILGAIETAGNNPNVLRLIRDAGERYPSLQITIHEEQAGALVAALEDGVVDLALVTRDTGAGHEETVERIRFTSDTVDCALLPAGHELARRPRLQRDDLAALPFLIVTPQAGTDYYQRAMRILEVADINPSTVVAFDGMKSAWDHIAHGKGWSFGLHRHQAQAPAGCAAVPIEGLAVPWGLDLMWRRGERVPAIQQLVGIAQEIVAGGRFSPGTGPRSPGRPSRSPSPQKPGAPRPAASRRHGSTAPKGG